MKVAIVGCGKIAEAHVMSLRLLGYDVALAVSRRIDQAKVFAEKWNIGLYHDSLQAELLENIDVVHICTPPLSHFDLVKQCLNAGKHVLCEKPLCLSKEQAWQLTVLARRKQLVNAINFNNRFYAACKHAADIVRHKSFGQARVIQCSYHQEFDALPGEYSWRHDKQGSGHLRTTSEIGSHAIDLIRNWTGLEIVALSASFACFEPVVHVKDGIRYKQPKPGSLVKQLETEDAAVVSLKFSNGAIGNLLLSEVSHGRTNNLKLEVVGERQSVWWESESPYHLHTAQKQHGINTSVFAFSQNLNETITHLIEQVYQHIVSGNHLVSYPSFYDGYVNAQICEAIYDSAISDGKWVEMEQVEL